MNRHTMKIWDEAMGVDSEASNSNPFRPAPTYMPPKPAFKVGDLVHVYKQPGNQFVQLKGERAVIEEIKGDWAQIETLRIDGEVTGSGSVPLDCLGHEPSSVWLVALDKKKAKFAQMLAEHEARQKLWEAGIKRIAKEHLVSRRKAIAIHKAIEGLRDQIR